MHRLEIYIGMLIGGFIGAVLSFLIVIYCPMSMLGAGLTAIILTDVGLFSGGLLVIKYVDEDDQ